MSIVQAQFRVELRPLDPSGCAGTLPSTPSAAVGAGDFVAVAKAGIIRLLSAKAPFELRHAFRIRNRRVLLMRYLPATRSILTLEETERVSPAQLPSAASAVWAPSAAKSSEAKTRRRAVTIYSIIGDDASDVVSVRFTILPVSYAPTCVATCGELPFIATALDSTVTLWDFGDVNRHPVRMARFKTPFLVAHLALFHSYVVFASAYEVRMACLHLSRGEPVDCADDPVANTDFEVEFEEDGFVSVVDAFGTLLDLPTVARNRDDVFRNGEEEEVVHARKIQRKLRKLQRPFLTDVCKTDWSLVVQANRSQGYSLLRTELLFHRRFLSSDHVHELCLTGAAMCSPVFDEPVPDQRRANAYLRLFVSTADQGFLYDVCAFDPAVSDRILAGRDYGSTWVGRRGDSGQQEDNAAVADGAEDGDVSHGANSSGSTRGSGSGSGSGLETCMLGTYNYHSTLVRVSIHPPYLFALTHTDVEMFCLWAPSKLLTFVTFPLMLWKLPIPAMSVSGLAFVHRHLLLLPAKHVPVASPAAPSRAFEQEDFELRPQQPPQSPPQSLLQNRRDDFTVLQLGPLTSCYVQMYERAFAAGVAPSESLQLLVEGHFMLEQRLSEFQASPPDHPREVLHMINLQNLLCRSFGNIADLLMEVPRAGLSAAEMYAFSDRSLRQVFATLKARSNTSDGRVALLRYLHVALEQPTPVTVDMLHEDGDLANEVLQYIAAHDPAALSLLLMQTCLFWSPYSPTTALEELRRALHVVQPNALDHLATAMLKLQVPELRDLCHESFQALGEERLEEFLTFNPGLLVDWSHKDALLAYLSEHAYWSLVDILSKLTVQGHILPDQALLLIPAEPPSKSLMLAVCYLEDALSFEIQKGPLSELHEDASPSVSDIVTELARVYIRLHSSGITPGALVNEYPGYDTWSRQHILVLPEASPWVAQVNDILTSDDDDHSSSASAYDDDEDSFFPRLERLLGGWYLTAQYDMVYETVCEERRAAAVAPETGEAGKAVAASSRDHIKLDLLVLPYVGRLEHSVAVVAECFPSAFLAYVTHYCDSYSDWKCAVDALEARLLSPGQDDTHEVAEMVQGAYKALLEHLVVNLEPREFVSLLPDNGDVRFFLPLITKSFCKLDQTIAHEEMCGIAAAIKFVKI